MNNENGHNNTISTVTQNWFLIGKNMCNAAVCNMYKLSPSIFYEF